MVKLKHVFVTPRTTKIEIEHNLIQSIAHFMDLQIDNNIMGSGGDQDQMT